MLVKWPHGINSPFIYQGGVEAIPKQKDRVRNETIRRRLVFIEVPALRGDELGVQGTV